jgi:hypothetical protein
MRCEQRAEDGMRRLASMLALVAMSAAAAASLRAAELEIPVRRGAPDNISMQKGPPNCARWTDECVNCTRGADGEAPVCSNVGIACQPKAIRCVNSEPAIR